jgi:probable HAF family extracellular repeat protein
MERLLFPPDTLALQAVAMSINNYGVIVGEVTDHAPGNPNLVYGLAGALWTGGGASEFPGQFTPLQLNDAGKVVGYVPWNTVIDGIPSTFSHAGVSIGGGATDIGTLNSVLGSSVARDINTSGSIVGYSVGGSGNAFLFKDGAMTDLNEVSAATPCWTLTEAQAINDKGQIACYGVTQSDPGKLHACLLTPTRVTGIAQNPAAAPVQFALFQNYPNPFNPSTTIRYNLRERSHVVLTVFNTLGQQVASLVNGDQETGYHEVKFDGSGLSSGVYFSRIEAGSFDQTRKLLLIR